MWPKTKLQEQPFLQLAFCWVLCPQSSKKWGESIHNCDTGLASQEVPTSCFHRSANPCFLPGPASSRSRPSLTSCLGAPTPNYDGPSKQTYSKCASVKHWLQWICNGHLSPHPVPPPMYINTVAGPPAPPAANAVNVAWEPPQAPIKGRARLCNKHW